MATHKNSIPLIISTDLSDINVVAAALIDENMKVLLAKRPSHKALGGFWEFPGGKIENNESQAQALVRELKEELSIKVEENNFIFLKRIDHIYPTFNLKMAVYVLHKWQNEVQNIEHQEIAWVALKDLEFYSTPPADVDIITALKTYLRSYEKRLN